MHMRLTCLVRGSSLESEKTLEHHFLPSYHLLVQVLASCCLLKRFVRINQERKIAAVLRDFPEANKHQLYFVSPKQPCP